MSLEMFRVLCAIVKAQVRIVETGCSDKAIMNEAFIEQARHFASRRFAHACRFVICSSKFNGEFAAWVLYYALYGT
jgi:hypothetical protein